MRKSRIALWIAIIATASTVAMGAGTQSASACALVGCGPLGNRFFQLPPFLPDPIR